jgi:hypothetical protein
MQSSDEPVVKSPKGLSEDRLEAEQAIPEIIKSLRLLDSTSSNDDGDSPVGDRVSPEELPRVFDGVVELIPTLVVEEYITPRQATAIQAVHRALGDLASQSDSRTRSTVDSPSTEEEWTPVRRAARRALDEMNALTPNRPRTACPD